MLKEKKIIKSRIIRTILITLSPIIAILFLINITPHILSFFAGDDIAIFDDSDMMLEAINISEEENSFYVLQKIPDILNFENVPKGKNLSTSQFYLDSDQWESNKIEKILNDNKQALTYFDKASQMEKYQSPFTANPDELSATTQIVPLNYIRQISRLAGVKAIWLAKQNKKDKAFEEIIKIMKIGDMIENSQDFLITHLVAISVKRTGINTIQKIIEITSINDIELLTYKKQLELYMPQNNTQIFKVEYLTAKNTLNDITRGNLSLDTMNRFPKKSYYYKPNLTLKYYYDFYSQIIKEYNKSCTEFKNIKTVKEYKTDSFLDITKLYFTENIVGKMLYSLSDVILNRVKIQECELQEQINAINNDIKESNQKTNIQIDKNNTTKNKEVISDTKEDETTKWNIYNNKLYNFKLNFPNNYSYCLDDICEVPIPNYKNYNEYNIQYFTFTHHPYPEYDPTVKYEILPRKNNLNINAIEFGEKIKIQNEKTKNYIPNSAKKITFAGQKAYSFDINGGFEENGTVYDKASYNKKPITGVKMGSGTFGILLNSKHRIVYFDKDEILYRFIYPINKNSEKIISTFKFTDKN